MALTARYDHGGNPAIARKGTSPDAPKDISHGSRGIKRDLVMRWLEKEKDSVQEGEEFGMLKTRVRSCVTVATNGTVDVGASITAGDNPTTPWLSASQDFAFGFKQLQDNNLFLLSIWYYKIPDQTIVWYANEGVPVSAGSKVEITAGKGLVLSDPQGGELWSSTPIRNQVANGFMGDTGSFVLVGGGSVNIWESFKYPTDTLLPTQIMESGGVLFSRQSEKNFSRGRLLLEHFLLQSYFMIIELY
ncbi:hypothetical protein RHGRI_001977 [Rhododendron griersonianum]|uniref:Bulb-type lectin domain-containing protein n=1 Tax=Rhododendron griersonianum TaxID=479676 RepID=A0AAV6LR20_9ERIC|nr:hypothetical protein RHGRI_001977 [Rhododendron griersonianum]